MARKPKESAGYSRGTRADDFEKYIKGSDKAPAEQKKVARKFPTKAQKERVAKAKAASAPIKAREAANQAAKKAPVSSASKAEALGRKAGTVTRKVLNAAKTVGKGALKVGRAAMSVKGALALGAASYIGGKIKDAWEAEGKTRSKLEADARNDKRSAPAKASTTSPTGNKSTQSPTGNGAKASSAPQKAASASIKSVKTKGGEYKVYKKDSAEGKDFRSQFAAARKAGKKEFTWQGRKYNTKTK